MKKIVLIIIVQLQFLTLLVAQDRTWNGSVSTSPANASNWTPNGIPPSPLTVNLTIPFPCSRYPSFGPITIGGSSTSGSITINSGARATFSTLTIGNQAPGTITNGGNILINGTLQIGNFDNGSGVINNTSTGNISVWYPTTIGGSGTNAAGTITNSGIITFNDVLFIGDGFNYSNGILTNNNTFTSSEVTINSNGQLILNPSSKSNVDYLLTNSGRLDLKSSGSGISSLILDSYSGTGTVNADIYLTGGGSPNYNWHYIAIPFEAGFSKSLFVTGNDNLLGYDESRVSTSEGQGWFWHDGAAANGIVAGTAFSTLYYGKGYNYYHIASNATYTLSSTSSLGTSLGSVSPAYSGTSDNLSQFGYNLLGNSLTCSIDWDYVTFSGSVSNTVYYTTGNKWATYLTGAGGTNGGARYIPPLQGFFVKANATSASVDFTGANVKVHSTQGRYKKGSDSQEETKGDIIYPKVKLELTGNNTADETIVWFNENATTGYDEKYDGFKLFSSDASFGQLYSILNGNQFVINGIPLPSSTLTVPLGIMIPQSGVYSLDKKVLEVLDNYNVSLIDKMNGNYTVDIKSVNSYSFSSDAGIFTDRFVLKFDNILTGVENLPIVNKKFNVYGTKDFINIMPFDDFTNETTVRIYNLTGKIVKQANISGFYKGSLLQLPFEGSQGIYIVEIRSGSIQISRDKVFVN